MNLVRILSLETRDTTAANNNKTFRVRKNSASRLLETAQRYFSRQSSESSSVSPLREPQTPRYGEEGPGEMVSSSIPHSEDTGAVMADSPTYYHTADSGDSPTMDRSNTKRVHLIIENYERRG